MKKVALIQSKKIFTRELKEKYLGNIPICTTVNHVKIFNFIKQNANEKGIFKYILHVNSDVLDKFIDYIYIQKRSKTIKALLSKCTLVATYSNADSVREKNIKKNTNIYFSLSPVSEVIKSYLGYPPDRAMLVVSNLETPYYNQIYDSDIIPKYRISDLTVDKINNFAKTAIIMIVALDTLEETKTLTELILQSNYSQVVASIESVGVEELLQIKNKVSSLFIRSSGVGIWGNVEKYVGLNKYDGYEICAAVLVDTYKLWKEYIRKHTISVSSPKFNVSYYFF